MRIASLVPSATETLFALGLGDDVVAVTHECDYPPAAESLPHLTRSVIPEGLGPAEIDRAVRERTERGEVIYELDAEALEELQPDLIVTQALCAVCAVSVDDVRAVAETFADPPVVLPLDPSTLGEVLNDVRTLADATGVPSSGEALVAQAAQRIDWITRAVEGATRPRVAALEWLDPVFIGGHWVPQLIDLAGGEDVLGLPGERSQTVTWDLVRASSPEVVICMPCGYDADRAAEEAHAFAEELESLDAHTIVAVDAAAYYSRPGPRLVDGLELLAHVLHPDRVDPPPPNRLVPVRTPGPESVR
ncbi:MAG: iron complex transport system substrate-binding protein [Thermoleophilaceae bacterium]|nr:iron complex transport system substrate-binding protein [Thermoleophilaceae bacterium]